MEPSTTPPQPPAPSPAPPVAPTPGLSPVGGNPLSSGPNAKLILGIIIGVIVLACATGAYVMLQTQHKTATAQPTPAAITTSDVEQLLKDADDATADVDANLPGLDTALTDQQGDLSE